MLFAATTQTTLRFHHTTIPAGTAVTVVGRRRPEPDRLESHDAYLTFVVNPGGEEFECLDRTWCIRIDAYSCLPHADATGSFW